LSTANAQWATHEVKLAAANRIALEAQRITPDSRVLTVCRMTHAGGALAQTLPALSIGAHVDIVPFNAFSFLRNVAGYTHTHPTPAHCELVMQTRSFPKADLAGLFVASCAWRVWRCTGMLRPVRSEYRIAFVKLATGQSK